MRKPFKICFVFIALFLLPLILLGQEEKEPITISGKASSSEIFIGDQFTYELKVEWQKGYEVLQVEPPLEMGKFELLEVRPQTASDKKGFENTRIYTYTLSTYDTGDFEIPSFTVTYKTPEGEEKKAQSQPIAITVKPILHTAGDNFDIRDVKAPFSIPAKPYLRNFLIGAGAFVLILAVALYLIIRHLFGKKQQAPVEWIPPRPIEELAMEDIQALEISSLLAEGRIKEYYSRISEIIRVYLGRRFKVNAIDLTSYELLCTLEDKEIRDEVFKILEGFLDTCDLVKFAKYKPEEAVHTAITEKARLIVRETTPSPAAAVPDSSQNGNNNRNPEKEESPEPVISAKGGANP
jgi:hypothetical protein